MQRDGECEVPFDGGFASWPVALQASEIAE
jgi:hypothetical protein